MMKTTLLLILFIGLVYSAHGQDYLDEVASSSCECIENVGTEGSVEEMHMDLGLCMLEASLPYKEQMMKDHNINLDNIDGVEGEKLGQLLAMRMMGKCPKLLTKFIKKQQSDEQDPQHVFIEGEITSVDKNDFVVLTVKEENGKSTKLYWLTFVESNLDLTQNFQKLKGSDVKVGYTTVDMFDLKLKEYRSFKILNSVEKL